MMDGARFFYDVWFDRPPRPTDLASFIETMGIEPARMALRWKPLDQGAISTVQPTDIGALTVGLRDTDSHAVSITVRTKGLLFRANYHRGIGPYKVWVHSAELLEPAPVEMWVDDPSFNAAAFGRYEDLFLFSPLLSEQDSPLRGDGGWPTGPDYPAGTVWVAPSHLKYELLANRVGYQRTIVGSRSVLRVHLYDTADPDASVREAQEGLAEYFGSPTS